MSTLLVATANVNGIRAAHRRGMLAWLAECRPDVLCLQEVRAPREALLAVLAQDGCWHVADAPSDSAGRAGVAVASRVPPLDVRVGLPGFPTAGRWIEADLPWGPNSCDVLTVISAYVHTGEAQTPRQQEKEQFLAQARARLDQLRQRSALLCGDLNIAHREVDLKNWKGNVTKSGFLPQERAWLDDLTAAGAGWVDVTRSLAGPGPGPYSWWSWRGQAFDNDAGWRIDYHLASPLLAERAVRSWVDRAPSYAQRWSDHAPVLADYRV